MNPATLTPEQRARLARNYDREAQHFELLAADYRDIPLIEEGYAKQAEISRQKAQEMRAFAPKP
jgi:hypothetical protein